MASRVVLSPETRVLSSETNVLSSGVVSVESWSSGVASVESWCWIWTVGIGGGEVWK